MGGPLAPSVLAADGLTLEPLRVDHAGEMAAVLDDQRLHTFTGGSPPSGAGLRRRYAAQVRGRSGDGRQTWLNRVVRDDETGLALGYVQATLVGSRVAGDLGGTGDAGGSAGPVGHLAWVVGADHQGRVVASRAAVAMADWLRSRGVTAHVADVHPDHSASQAVARRVGLHRSDEVVDGEERWTSGDEG